MKTRIKRIMEGTMYMMYTDKNTWPLPEDEFDKLMNLVEVLNLEKQLYMQKTKLILDLFDLVLNFNPKAPEDIRNEYRQNILDKIKLVKQTISC